MLWWRRALELACTGLASIRMGDLLGGKIRVFISVNHCFSVIFLCNFKKNSFAMGFENGD